MKQNRASKTAKFIAAATILRTEHHIPRHAPPPPTAAQWCEKFLSTAPADRRLLRSIRSPLGRLFWRLLESLTIPHIINHWIHRKNQIDALARQAAADGYTQLLLLGAGLDSLPFRLHHEKIFPHILSADHPSTLSLLRTALPHSPIPLLPLDLTSPNPISNLPLDLTQPTLIIIEGVLMYLPPPTVHSLLASLAKIPTPKTRLIASYMLTTPHKPIGFHPQSPLIPLFLRHAGEPMLWSASTLPPLLHSLGWPLTKTLPLLLPSEQLLLTEIKHPLI